MNRANIEKLKIVLGTDISSFPCNIHEAKELQYFEEKAGFTTMEAIQFMI